MYPPKFEEKKTKMFKKFNQSEIKSNLGEKEPFLLKNVPKLVILGHFWSKWKIYQAPQRLVEKKLTKVSPKFWKIPVSKMLKIQPKWEKSNLSENEPFLVKNVSNLVILGHFWSKWKIFQAPQRLLEKKLEEVSHKFWKKYLKCLKNLTKVKKKSNLSENEPYLLKNVPKIGHFCQNFHFWSVLNKGEMHLKIDKMKL